MVISKKFMYSSFYQKMFLYIMNNDQIVLISLIHVAIL